MGDLVLVVEQLEPEQEIYTSDIKVLFRINEKLSLGVRSLTSSTPGASPPAADPSRPP